MPCVVSRSPVQRDHFFPIQCAVCLIHSIQERPGADPVSLMNLPADRLLVFQTRASLLVSVQSQGSSRLSVGWVFFCFQNRSNNCGPPPSVGLQMSTVQCLHWVCAMGIFLCVLVTQCIFAHSV